MSDNKAAKPVKAESKIKQGQSEPKAVRINDDTDKVSPPVSTQLVVAAPSQLTARFDKLRDRSPFIYQRNKQLPEVKALISEVDPTVLTIKDFDKLDNGLVVRGLQLAPVAKDLVYKKDEIVVFPEGVGAEWYPYRFNHVNVPDGTLFDVYVFEMDGRLHTYLLNKGSKAWIDLDVSAQYTNPWQMSKNSVDHKRGANVLMVDAEVRDCVLFNSVTLCGGKYDSCLISDTTIDCSAPKEDDGGYRPRYHNQFLGEYKNSYFERSTLKRSTADQGDYHGVQLTDSNIECKGRVNVKNSTLERSTVRTNQRIALNNANLEHCWINCQNFVGIANQTLRNSHFTTPSVFARNKLAITEIDAPHGRHRALFLVRTDVNTMELYGGSVGESFKIKLDRDGWELRNEVEEWVGKALPLVSPHDDRPPESKPSNDPLLTSILRYVVDTIMSRLNVIKSIDSATELTRQLEPRDTTDEFSMYF